MVGRGVMTRHDPSTQPGRPGGLEHARTGYHPTTAFGTNRQDPPRHVFAAPRPRPPLGRNHTRRSDRTSFTPRRSECPAPPRSLGEVIKGEDPCG